MFERKRGEACDHVIRIGGRGQTWIGLSGIKPDPRQSDETDRWVGLYARQRIPGGTTSVSSAESGKGYES